MIPRVQKQLLRAHDRDGALARDLARERERGAHDALAPALDDARDEAEAERVRGAERARGVRELVQERGRGERLGRARERADVRGQPDIHFL